MKKIITLTAVGLALAGIIIWLVASHQSRITVHGLVSDDKEDLFANQDIKKMLDDRNIHVEEEVRKTGDIVQDDPGKNDFVVLNSEVSAKRFTAKFEKKVLKEEAVFGTALIILTWKPVVEVLKANQLITEENGVLYSDFKPLLDLHQRSEQWENLKQTNKDLTSAIRIGSAHPKYANSGKMTAMLVASMYAGPSGVNDSNQALVMPEVHKFFQNNGSMDHSPGEQFNGILKKSWTLHPLTIVYENQLIEYALANPQVWEANKDRIRLIYIKPTLWAEIHVLALTENGVKFLELLHDPLIQTVASERHGMRVGIGGDITASQMKHEMGIAPVIRHAIPLPSNSTINNILNQLPNY